MRACGCVHVCVRVRVCVLHGLVRSVEQVLGVPVARKAKMSVEQVRCSHGSEGFDKAGAVVLAPACHFKPCFAVASSSYRIRPQRWGT